MSESVVVYARPHKSTNAYFFVEGDIVLYMGPTGDSIRAYAVGVVDGISDNSVLVHWWVIGTREFQQVMKTRADCLVRIGRVVG